MTLFRELIFKLLNKPEDRAILNKWKREGRIPENYCRSIQEIASDVEDEYRRENKLPPVPYPVLELYDTSGSNTNL
jgi:hypothetical protein